jgi:hypothetical protein
VHPGDAADEGVGDGDPGHKRARMMEGGGKESAQGSVSAPEKRKGRGLKARGAGGKAKRPLDVTSAAGGEPTDDVIDATSSAKVAARQSEGGAGEVRVKRVRKDPKLFGEN